MNSKIVDNNNTTNNNTTNNNTTNNSTIINGDNITNNITNNITIDVNSFGCESLQHISIQDFS